MRLRLLLPTRVLLDEAVLKVAAEGAHGAFCLLPRHIDFVVSLVPGILSYWNLDGEERFVATAEGALVKTGPLILVSVRRAIEGTDLESLRELVEETFRDLDEKEKQARSAVARLEAGILRRFVDLREEIRAE